MNEVSKATRWGVESGINDPTLPPFAITDETRGKKRELYHVGYAYVQADANLIASAPELLEALEAFLSDPNVIASGAVVKKARAAIEKARGAS